MKGFKWCLSGLVALTVFGGSLAYGASILTLTTNPTTGLISGGPGQTIGWGFTLVNSSDNYALITGADFCGAVITSPCSTPLGIFTDFIGPSFTVINPHSSLSDVFNAISHTGIGSYAINPATPKGSAFLGQVVLTYDTFTDSSFSNQVGFDDRATAPASIAVPAPESATWTLLATGLVGLCWVRRLLKVKRLDC
jgi:hypothetical protein